jgi:hypothetical protein
VLFYPAELDEKLYLKTMSQSTNTNESKALATVQTRILIALWTLEEATRGELKSNLVRKREKEASASYKQRAELYLEAVSKLEGIGAFSTRGTKLVLSDIGHELLGQGLLTSEFAFDAQIGAKTANALLKWMRQLPPTSTVRADQKASKISTYQEFQTSVLSTFDRLNRDFSLDNLVPIYRIRREMGDQVERNLFDRWLLEMQAQDIAQLIGGEMPELTPDKAEDSIKTTLGGIRYYMKRL